MEIDILTIEDEKMDTPESRYERLHAIVNEIASNPMERSDQWYDEHAQLLVRYDQAFGKFDTVNSDIKHPEFRMKCKMLDNLMTKLLTEYNCYRWFSLYDYNRFNQLLIWTADYTFQFRDIITAEGEDLTSLMESMKV